MLFNVLCDDYAAEQVLCIMGYNTCIHFAKTYTCSIYGMYVQFEHWCTYSDKYNYLNT